MTFTAFELALPPWCQRLTREWHTTRRVVSNEVAEAHGWPMVAVWQQPTPGLTNQLGLPIRPIWSGLLIDSALWGAALAGIYASTRNLRHFIRESRWLRRGCCMRCGYDLRFDLARGCPECGWRREAA
jgi:hypothetical protein